MSKFKSTVVDGVEYALVPLEKLWDLLENDAWLSILNAAGIDNWEGSEYASDLAKEEGFFETYWELEDSELKEKFIES